MYYDTEWLAITKHIISELPVKSGTSYFTDTYNPDGTYKSFTQIDLNAFRQWKVVYKKQETLEAIAAIKDAFEKKVSEGKLDLRVPLNFKLTRDPYNAKEGIKCNSELLL